jgi:hypothetical protein
VPDVLRTRVEITRHHPQFPLLAAVPKSLVAPWKLGTATTTVEATLNGVPLGRRSLKYWKDRDGWWIDLPDALATKAGVKEGDRAPLELRRAATALPAELAALIAKSKTARAAWERLTPAQQRVLREEVAAAKQSTTRARRAARMLGLET